MVNECVSGCRRKCCESCIILLWKLVYLKLCLVKCFSHIRRSFNVSEIMMMCELHKSCNFLMVIKTCGDSVWIYLKRINRRHLRRLNDTLILFIPQLMSRNLVHASVNLRAGGRFLLSCWINLLGTTNEGILNETFWFTKNLKEWTLKKIFGALEILSQRSAKLENSNGEFLSPESI